MNREVRSCLALLDVVDKPHYRPDTRRAAQKAKRVIADLVARLEAHKPKGPRNSLGRNPEEVALRVVEKAKAGRVVLFLSPKGDYRWNRGGAYKGEWIGNYSADITYEDVLGDIHG